MTQPYLHAQSIVLQAPVQCWSRHDGQVVLPAATDTSIAQGLFHGDDRVLSRLELSVTGRVLEHIATSEPGGSTAHFDHVVRTPELGVDPQVVVERHRHVTGSTFTEDYVVRSAATTPQDLELVVILTPDATPMAEIKSGLAPTPVAPAAAEGSSVRWHWRDEGTTVRVDAPGATLGTEGDHHRIVWPVSVPARGEVTAQLRIELGDDGAPFVATTAGPLARPDLASAEPRVRRLVAKAFSDLESLRLAERDAPGAAFLAAGAPWFFTLFGRDSLIAARLLLPGNVELAASTLEVLAGRQGTRTNTDNAEQPGKILHEVRRVELELHDTAQVVDASDPEGERPLTLPPEYYGTIDATPLWILLFADAVAAGMDAGRARALLPALRGALGWIRDHGDADGDGFLEYFDQSGHGLANQGWKDSGDSVRWADGSLAKGPIALVEVQGYAYAALRAGCALLRQLDPGADDAGHDAPWLALADDLRARFRDAFWTSDELGRYPGIALDADKRLVDGVSSNMGHLLGTGILDADEARIVVERLMDPTMLSGYGIRTLSTTNAGYWPLGYHVGSVWTHDTAVILDGMLREGFTGEAAVLARQLLDAAEGFGFRMPELFSGTPASEAWPALPYPAACRPQAWAAASTVPIVRALHPDVC